MEYSALFCRIYDTYGWNYYPETFGENLISWMKRRGIRPSSAVDVGCGTGMLSHILTEHGIHTMGIDLAEEMINIARRTYPEIPFEVADLTVFRPEEAVELVTATCDVFNHLPDAETLEKGFANVYSYLKEGGLFVFDLLKDKEVPACEAVDLGEEDGCRYEYGITRGEEGRVILSIRAFRTDTGELFSLDEIHERIYEPDQVAYLLRKCGFTEVIVCDTLSEDSGLHGTDWIFICRK